MPALVVRLPGTDGETAMIDTDADPSTWPEPIRAKVEAAEARRAAALADLLAVKVTAARPGADPEPVTETRTLEPTTAPDWPAPPDDAAYHGLAGTIVRAIAPHTEADPVGLLGTFLAIFATRAGNGWGFHQGDWQAPALFVALVGETAIGRKGTAFGNIREAFNLADESWKDVLVTGLGSGEGLITYLRDHEGDPRALVLETEFGRLLTAMTREGSTLSPIIRNAWDGVPLGRQVASRKQSGSVADHHVGILANITNVELARLLTSSDAANGFGNRFLWLAVRRGALQPFTQPVGGLVSPFIPSLKAALEFAGRRGQMRRTLAGDQWWEAFYRNRRPRVGLAGALTARAEAYVVRLSMIYALLDGETAIDVPHLEAARALWEYAERSALYVFGDSTGDRHADALLKMLRRDGGRVGYLEAKREIGLYRAADMDDVVRLLETLGLARLVRVEKSSGGRPRREIEVAR